MNSGHFGLLAGLPSRDNSQGQPWILLSRNRPYIFTAEHIYIYVYICIYISSYRYICYIYICNYIYMHIHVARFVGGHGPRSKTPWEASGLLCHQSEENESEPSRPLLVGWLRSTLPSVPDGLLQQSWRAHISGNKLHAELWASQVEELICECSHQTLR